LLMFRNRFPAQPLRFFGGLFKCLCCLGVLYGICACKAPGDAGSSFFHGPMPYKSLMPLSALFPHPVPDKAVPLRRGQTEIRWSSLYGSVLVKEASGLDQMQVDGEFLRTTLWVKEGLTDRIEVGIELPFLHNTGGFMDSAIEDFHDFFGFPQGKRDKNPDDQYTAVYQKDGRIFLSSEENGLHRDDRREARRLRPIGMLEQHRFPESDDRSLARHGTGTLADRRG